MVKTKVGDLNKIWKRKKLEELCELVRGIEPGSNAYFNEQKEGSIQFIRVGDITGKINSTKFVKKLKELFESCLDKAMKGELI